MNAQSIVDEYKNLEVLLKLINRSNNEGIELKKQMMEQRIDIKNIKIYNSILKINKKHFEIIIKAFTTT